MKNVILSVLVVALAIAQVDRGLAQERGTQAELWDDALAVALWHIAVETHTRIGFQSVEFTRQFLSMKSAPTFPVASRDKALRAVVDADPRYEWRVIGDFVVVRPKAAWNDAADPLNRRVNNLRVESTTESGTLSGVRSLVYTGRFEESPGSNGGTPVAFNLPSGNAVDALNQLIQSADDVMWHAAYRPNARLDQRAPVWDLQLQLYGVTGPRSGLASCPALPCVAKH